MSFEDPNIAPESGDEGGYEAPQSYEAPQYQSPAFDPEVNAALTQWFEQQVGPVLRPIQEAHRAAEMERSVSAVEARYDLSTDQMNSVLETALSFGPKVVNAMPLDRLMDYAVRVWSGSQPQPQREAPGQVAPQGKEKDRFAAVNDAFSRADTEFARMEQDKVDQRQRLNELRDREQREARGYRDHWDQADERAARLIRQHGNEVNEQGYSGISSPNSVRRLKAGS